MNAPKGRLTPLQVDVLHRFFSRTDSFFLTGGAVPELVPYAKGLEGRMLAVAKRGAE